MGYRGLRPVGVGVARWVFLLMVCALALLPIVWMAGMAFKPISEWTPAPGEMSWLPKAPTWGNFVFVFTGEIEDSSFSLERNAVWPMISSVVTASFGTLIAASVGTLAAYAAARLGRGRDLRLPLLQLRLFPPLAVMIPLIIMWAYLGLNDTWYGLALIYGIVSLPFAFWLMVTFFDEIPPEIEEAAIVEGCSTWRVFIRVTLPMVRGPLATTILFVFVINWSDYAIALLLTQKYWVTIPVYMDGLATGVAGQMYGAKAALGLIAAVPPLLIGLAIQKHLVRGLTFGALKQ